MIYTCSNDLEYEKLCLFVNDALKFLKVYGYLTDSFILEFYNDNQWNLLPRTWRSIFKSFTIDDLHAFIQGKITTKILPLSLLCFQRCAKIYRFENQEASNIRCNYHGSDNLNDKTTKQTQLKPESLELLNKFLCKHLKPKKVHEIDRLSSLIAFIADQNLTLFDIGSGQGHLSRHLAFKHNFKKVISIDVDSKFLSKAKQFDNQLVNDLKFLDCNLKPKQINFNLNKENYKQIISDENEFGLIGLHTCGNLSHDLLELHKNSESRCLFLCSCCYHKTKEDRYLISEHLKKSHTLLSVETRANACHSLDNFISSFETKPEELKVHTYRALLEYLLELKSPANRKRTLCKAHQLTAKTFSDYVNCVIGKGKENLLDKLDLNSTETKQLIEDKLKENLNVISFYSCRTLLGPVTESILLADRMIFLYESKKIKSKLVPLFDVKLSPRNFVLISIK